MSALRYDWSRIRFATFGDTPWTASDAQAFARRVEKIADEEKARVAALTPTEPECAS